MVNCREEERTEDYNIKELQVTKRYKKITETMSSDKLCASI